MTVLAVIVGLVFLVTFAGWPPVGGGWFWDFGNALGFLALAGLLFQMIPYTVAGLSARVQRPLTKVSGFLTFLELTNNINIFHGVARVRLRATRRHSHISGPARFKRVRYYARGAATKRHEHFGYWVLAVAMMHAFWFLAGDGAVRVYLQPGAPLYMWLGLIALVAMAVLTALARMPDRMRVHRRFRAFRTVHRVLGFAVVAAAGLHVMLTGFYLSRWLQDLLLVLLVAASCFGRAYWARLGRLPVASGAAFAVTGVVAAGAFLLARNLGW